MWPPCRLRTVAVQRAQRWRAGWCATLRGFPGPVRGDDSLPRTGTTSTSVGSPSARACAEPTGSRPTSGPTPEFCPRPKSARATRVAASTRWSSMNGLPAGESTAVHVMTVSRAPAPRRSVPRCARWRCRPSRSHSFRLLMERGPWANARGTCLALSPQRRRVFSSNMRCRRRDDRRWRRADSHRGPGRHAHPTLPAARCTGRGPMKACRDQIHRVAASPRTA